MKPENAIEITDVSMKFNLYKENVDNLKEYFIKYLKRQLSHDEFWALKNISLEIAKGDSMALIGRNGSGKSTLLKIIAGVLKPTKGTVERSGSIAPLIELGAGFDPDLTARENVYLNGAMLGYSRSMLDEKYDDIISFAELEPFVDVPLKNFSSGMYARLGFAIATIAKPDILIIDEVLSVGDFKFQEKCEERIAKMMEGGTTVLFVSHSIEQVKKICNKAAWLDHGTMVMHGDVFEVCDMYSKN
ncbi:ABC transporter ATP-binding protein [Parasporobacterium paucivorans]|uniref:ABC-2 type transport system ATP-binding protein n=1 Tax=Parasporobacterium paucivorans DSM 15970 TaxID=1122934 RepID=A0A1M6JUH2_9FIRM|nr:ABC transporter ATP-binding protein [Parasporobacterium paucivorans]SHJ50395.1 ABC-2 type transport system ATP-binding protein [Parasporobacterium paucivorans DSM 15970]